MRWDFIEFKMVMYSMGYNEPTSSLSVDDVQIKSMLRYTRFSPSAMQSIESLISTTVMFFVVTIALSLN